MFEESIKSIRQLGLSSLLILFLWLLSWPAMEMKFELNRQVRDLQAWLLLKENIGAVEDSLFDFEPGESISGLTRTVEMGGQDASYEETVPLTLFTNWPATLAQGFELLAGETFPEPPLRASTSFRIYDIETDSRELPFNSYRVVTANQRMARIIPAEIPVRASDLPVASMRLLEREINKMAVPRSWGRLEIHLRKYGFQGAYHRLSTQTDALAKLQIEADPEKSSVNVMGLGLNMRIFMLSVGFILAGTAFAMIGPYRMLRGGAPQSHPWVMVTPTTSRPADMLLEAAILAIGCAWTVSPLIIAWCQLGMEAHLSPVERLLFWLNMLALLFTAVVFSIVFLLLRRLRRNR